MDPLPPRSAPTVLPFDRRRAAEPPASPEAQLRERAVMRALFPDAPPPPPPRFGRYVLLGKIDRGAMGTVLEAHDPQLDRRVALKLLHVDETSEPDPDRVRDEGRALARVSHPNVVQVFEAGEVDGRPFVAMERVEGMSLRTWQDRWPRPSWRACVEVYLGAGRGLRAVHEARLVHRDFKPDNCMIDGQGRARVLDFGLVTPDAAPETTPTRSCTPPESDDALVTRLTRTGGLVGTMPYMALEQLQGRPADARSDQFAFCASLFEAIHGLRPFAGASAEDLIRAQQDPRGPAMPMIEGVPARLRRALLRGLRPDPHARWPSMDALLAELQRVASPWPRRRAMLGLAAMLAMLAGSWWRPWTCAASPPAPAPCEGAAAELRGVWDEARRTEVAEALEASGRLHAPRAWDRVDRRLTDYAAAWRAEHTQACEATLVHGVQLEEDMGLRMGCLSHRRLVLREVVDALARPDPEGSVVDHVDRLLAALPSLRRCGDLAALHMEVPPPDDPEGRAAVDALRNRLITARIRHEAGASEGVGSRLDELVRRAEALDYPPLLAEARWQRGEFRADRGDPEGAEQDLVAAHRLALRHDHRTIQTASASALACVVGQQQGRLEHGEQWGHRALALAEREDTDPGVRAGAWGNLGLVLHQRGEHERALEHLRRALELKRRSGLGDEDPQIADTLDAIGNVLTDQGQLEPALLYHRRALALRQAALGPHHPSLAQSLGNVGTSLLRQHRLDQALHHYQLALSIQTSALGPEHPDLAKTLGNVAVVLYEQGQLEASLGQHQRALAIQRRVLGRGHVDVARTLGNIASIQHDLGDYDRALASYRRALAIFERDAPRSPDVPTTLANMALTLRALDQPDHALEHQLRALAILEPVLGAEHPAVGGLIADMGHTRLQLGQLEQARTSLLRALAIVEGTAEPTDQAYSRLGLALVSAAQGHPTHAHAQARWVVEHCAGSSRCAELGSRARALLPPEARADAPPRTGARSPAASEATAASASASRSG